MASGVYTAWHTACNKGDVDLDSHTIKLAIMNNSHTFNPDHDGWADVSANEASGTGYTAGGKAVTGLAVTSDDANNRTKITCDTVEWTGATLSGYHAVAYDDTHASKVLLASFDFGGVKSASGGPFTVTINANGLVTIASA